VRVSSASDTLNEGKRERDVQRDIILETMRSDAEQQDDDDDEEEADFDVKRGEVKTAVILRTVTGAAATEAEEDCCDENRDDEEIDK
jgi:hypothetical protein